MKIPIPTLAVILAFCLSACRAEPTPPQAPAGTQGSMLAPTVAVNPPSATSPQPDPAALFAGKVHDGMAYSELRKVALDHGWQPKPDAQCMANVVGGNYQKLCSAHPELSDCRICKEVPELSSCSADGHCLLQFSHEGFDKTLQVGTYGEIGDWSVPADKSRLSVTGWEYAVPVSH